MATLLVLGSKPDPTLPPRHLIDAVACANASGFSAARLGLPVPVFTVMSAILTDGSEAARLRLQALRGLGTRELVYLPRARRGRGILGKLENRLRDRGQRPEKLARALRAVDYRWERFLVHDHKWYRRLICELCGWDPEVKAQLRRKQASTGIAAVAVGAAQGGFDRIILAGFSFELTQAFGRDPNIARRGTTRSLHADTDTLVLARMSAHLGCLFTIEPEIAERSGIPYFPVQRAEATAV